MQGFAVCLEPTKLLACLFGVVVGTAMGVLPGIGPAGAVALLIPLTFHMDAASAVIMIAGIYYGTQYGGPPPPSSSTSPARRPASSPVSTDTR